MGGAGEDGEVFGVGGGAEEGTGVVIVADRKVERFNTEDTQERGEKSETERGVNRRGRRENRRCVYRRADMRDIILPLAESTERIRWSVSGTLWSRTLIT